MPLRTKRIYDPQDATDGYRLLVMRLWPRGVRKDAVDAWQKDLAPSEELRRAFVHGALPWEAFAKAYLEEMQARQELIHQLARQARDQTVTLLCSCRDEARCHRTLLRRRVESAADSALASP